MASSSSAVEYAPPPGSFFSYTPKEGGPEVKLHYMIHGSGPIKVLKVMGLGTSGLAWSPNVAFFSAFPEYAVCIFDNRGVGYSSAPPGFYKTSQMAQDALALATHIGFDKFHLIGISMGGMISQEIASTAPERILSLSLAVTHGGGIGTSPWAGIALIARSLFIKVPEERAANSLRMCYSEKHLEREGRDIHGDHAVEGKKMRDLLYEWNLTRITTIPPPGNYIGQLAACQTHNLSLARLRALGDTGYPILVFAATEDVLISTSHQLKLARDIGPRARLHVFEGSGHVVNVEEKMTFNTMIHDMIQEVEAKRVHGRAVVVQEKEQDRKEEDVPVVQSQ